MKKINYDESATVDGGYRHKSCILAEDVDDEDKQLHALRRLKQFNMLSESYRHILADHDTSFIAVA